MARKKPEVVRSQKVIYVDPKTMLEKPLSEMSSSGRAETLKGSESEATAKDRKSKNTKGKIGPRLEKTPATRKALRKAGIKEPSTRALNRGVTSVSTASKKRRVKEQTPIPEAKVGQIGKLGEQTVRVTPENLQQVSRQRRTTVLPTAGKSEMEPERQATPLPGPKTGLREPTFINKKGLGRRRKGRGFGAPVSQVSEMANKALLHVDGMRNFEPGTPGHGYNLYHFNEVMKKIQPVAKNLHTSLLAAQMIAVRPKYPEQQKHLDMAKDAIGEIISVGRQLEKDRLQSSKENFRKKG